MKKDSKLKSISESFANIIIGFPINYCANLLILPFYLDGWGTVEESLQSAFVIGVWFTIVSIIRTYGLRRLFNHYGKNETLLSLTIRGVRRIKKKFV